MASSLINQVHQGKKIVRYFFVLLMCNYLQELYCSYWYFELLLNQSILVFFIPCHCVKYYSADKLYETCIILVKLSHCC